MVQFTHILCPIDFSELSPLPVRLAAALARRYVAQLTLLHVAPTFDPVSVRPAELNGTVELLNPVSREEVAASLERVLESADATLEASYAADAGDPAARIVDQAVTIPADLIVIGTHGRGGFERFMLGSVAEKVLHKAPCPVLTVPPHIGTRDGGEVSFRRILCAVDFSPSSLQAFGFALDLARQFNASLTALHVIEWLAEEEPRTHAHFEVPEYRQHLIKDAEARLQALAAEHRDSSLVVDSLVHLGRPHWDILRVHTELDADLIVMGAQGRGGIGLALFGSTTQQVVRAAHCPVLTVRLADAASSQP